MTNAVLGRAKAQLQVGDHDAARELLLQEGFILRDDSEIQSEFIRLIPPSRVVAEKLKELSAIVSNSDPDVRYKGLGAVKRSVYKEYSKHTKAWLADPRISDIWIDALRDKDIRVAENAAAILAIVVQRYFADLRTFEPLVGVLQSKRKQMRVYAVFAIPYLARPDRWQVVLPHVGDVASEVRKAVCRGVLFDTAIAKLPAHTRKDIAQALRTLVSDEEDAETRRMAERGLQRLGA